MNKIFRLFFLFVFHAGILFTQTSEVVFLQMNDVYEIAPIQGGKYGGLARVSTIKQNLLKQNSYTFMVLSGDFISPSALGTSDYNGERINGAQMVDVLNNIGLDYATFGNHEFDYKVDVLQKRINESKFEWIVNNVKENQNSQLSKFSRSNGTNTTEFPEYIILRLPGYIKGQQIRIGITGICINNNKQPYVVYDDYYSSAKRIYNIIKDSIDCFVAMTHLEVEQDRELAKQLPEINLIMGGHEHVNNMEKVGTTIIAKADANAKTVYVHKLVFDMHNKLINIKSDLVNVDESIPEDPNAKTAVDLWVDRAYKGFIAKGFDPAKVVTTLTEPLDGRDEYIRTQQTNLGRVIAQSMLNASAGSDAAIFNSGSVRLDDELMGEVSQYDIIRTLPFGGKIIDVELKGSLLLKLLETGRKNSGSGGYLQYANISYDSAGGKWSVGNKSLDESANYKVAVSAYLLTGLEQNMAFFTKDNPDIIKIIEPDAANTADLRNDVRLAIISYLEKGGR